MVSCGEGKGREGKGRDSQFVWCTRLWAGAAVCVGLLCFPGALQLPWSSLSGLPLCIEAGMCLEGRRGVRRPSCGFRGRSHGPPGGLPFVPAHAVYPTSATRALRPRQELAWVVVGKAFGLENAAPSPSKEEEASLQKKTVPPFHTMPAGHGPKVWMR